MSSRLADELRLALGEIAEVCAELLPLVQKPRGYRADAIERAAACAMLHSFLHQIEKALTLIAREWDGATPASESWHRDLLKQMAVATDLRPAIFPPEILTTLGEFLAFRHLFRGASIVLMRWEKLVPLLDQVDPTHRVVALSLESFVEFIESQGG